jgi:hypothetical protein
VKSELVGLLLFQKNFKAVFQTIIKDEFAEPSWWWIDCCRKYLCFSDN